MTARQIIYKFRFKCTENKLLNKHLSFGFLCPDVLNYFLMRQSSNTYYSLIQYLKIGILLMRYGNTNLETPESLSPDKFFHQTDSDNPGTAEFILLGSTNF